MNRQSVLKLLTIKSASVASNSIVSGSRYRHHSFFKLFLLLFLSVLVSAQGFGRTNDLDTSILKPVADAFIRNGNYASLNYGTDTSLVVKSSTVAGYKRSSYLKFTLAEVSNISAVKLRVYGRNID